MLRGGVATARLVVVDDTTARHARNDGLKTPVRNDYFTVFQTGVSTSGEAFLSVGSAAHAYVYRRAMMNGSARNRGCFPAHVRVLAHSR